MEAPAPESGRRLPVASDDVEGHMPRLRVVRLIRDDGTATPATAPGPEPGKRLPRTSDDVEGHGKRGPFTGDGDEDVEGHMPRVVRYAWSPQPVERTAATSMEELDTDGHGRRSPYSEALAPVRGKRSPLTGDDELGVEGRGRKAP
jgi:hypothetical protein